MATRVGIVAPERDGAIESALAARGRLAAWLPFEAPADFVGRLRAFRPDVVLNLGRGRLAEEAAAALEIVGVAYSGSTPLAAGLAADDALRAAVLAARGLAAGEAEAGERRLTVLLVGNAPLTEMRVVDGGAPAWASDDLIARARALALAAAGALRCRDHARVEIAFDAGGAPRVGAVATDLPGLAARWGGQPAELADRLIRLIAATPPERRAYQQL